MSNDTISIGDLFTKKAFNSNKRSDIIAAATVTTFLTVFAIVIQQIYSTIQRGKSYGENTFHFFIIHRIVWPLFIGFVGLMVYLIWGSIVMKGYKPYSPYNPGSNIYTPSPSSF